MGELVSIKGIGPKLEKYFNNLGINTIKDLVYYYPKDYEAYEEIKNIIDLEIGEVATINATVVTKPSIFRNGHTTITSFWLDDGTARIRAYWFNIPFINKAITVGKNAIFRGKISKTKNGIVISQSKIFKSDVYEGLKGNLTPVYSLTRGLTNEKIKNAIRDVLSNETLCKKVLEEYLPAKIRKERRLCELSYAFNHIHFPDNLEDVKLARKRLVYDELFLFSLAMLSNVDKTLRIGRKELADLDKKDLDIYIKDLPFTLTGDQLKALNDIISDFRKCKKMNRLIEGDVGSGKTIVALLTALIVANKNIQTAFMVPTEVLAEQHFISTISFLSKSHDNMDFYVENGIYAGEKFTVALLTGSTKAKVRKNILEKLKNGNIDILIGTHALFSKDVEYHDLGLCIIDEQHRFGVNQRKALEDKSNNANVIIMSATPIPRTLALLLYANMDISNLVDKPKDRLKILNYVANTSEREKGYKAIKKQLELGHQAYVICPAIDKDEDEEVGSFANYQNVVEYAEKLKEFFGKDVTIGILHGKMKSNEKYDIMQRFKNGEIQILVSTTVIEVGVDVPNATFIMIEDAGAFGLAELHQLRGRVGRGKDQSYALFVDTNKTEKSKKRLQVLVDSTDGFYIAEEDMKLRGPGDIFGVKQSGDMDFKLADMYTDIGIFRAASTDAKEFLDKNIEITSEIKEKLDEYMKLGLVI